VFSAFFAGHPRGLIRFRWFVLAVPTQLTQGSALVLSTLGYQAGCQAKRFVPHSSFAWLTPNSALQQILFYPRQAGPLSFGFGGYATTDGLAFRDFRPYSI